MFHSNQVTFLECSNVLTRIHVPVSTCTSVMDMERIKLRRFTVLPKRVASPPIAFSTLSARRSATTSSR